MIVRTVRYRVDPRTGYKVRLPAEQQYQTATWKEKGILLSFLAGTALALIFSLHAYVGGSKQESADPAHTFDKRAEQEMDFLSGTTHGTTPSPDVAISNESQARQPAALPAELSGLQALQNWKGDLDGMVKRRVIRALVVYSKTMYFLDGGQERGISYEALKAFESSLNKKYGTGVLKIHVVPIPVSREELIPGLIQGRGDLAVANLTITPDRQQSVDFSTPVYENVDERIVTGPGAPPISTLDDLSGTRVWVRASSSYNESLNRLNDSFRAAGKAPIEIVPVSEYLESEDILEMANAGLYPVTVIDSHIGEFWAKVFRNIKIHKDLDIRTGGSIGWAFRKNSPRLRAVVNTFVGSHNGGTTFGNLLMQRYLKNTDWVRNNATSTEKKKFDRTVGIFRKYAPGYGFDYLLVAAQGYQESRLDQRVVSRSGAIGVMQVLPSTARDRRVNIPDLKNVDSNIHAGVKYLRITMDTYFKNEPMDELNRNLFAFASYNAGPARIAGLRKQARSMGLNPNIWFRNVEVVAAKQIGFETVQYVSNIFKYYLVYKQFEVGKQEKQMAKNVLR